MYIILMQTSVHVYNVHVSVLHLDMYMYIHVHVPLLTKPVAEGSSKESWKPACAQTTYVPTLYKHVDIES